MKKKITIVIPAFNEAKYLPDLIKRISEVNLSKYNMSKEIVLVDDGSTDGTKKIIKKFKTIKYIKQSNKGKEERFKKELKQQIDQ